MSKDGIGGAVADSAPVAQSATLAAARGTLPPSNPTTPNEKCKVKNLKFDISRSSPKIKGPWSHILHRGIQAQT
jgi:hypothetical protein